MEKVVEIDDKEHGLALLMKHDRFRKEKKFCDFTVKVGSEEIAVHKSILAAYSDYFNAMLSHDTSENQTGVVQMNHVDVGCVKKCIDFIYTGKTSVTEGKYEQLLHVAHMLQLQKLCDGIVVLLEEDLDPKSFFETKRLANMYDCKQLEENCDKFALNNLTQIAASDDFGRLDRDYVAFLLRSKDANATESFKCDALIKWTKYDSKSRKKVFEKLIKKLDLSALPLSYRRHLIEREPLICDQPKCASLFMASILDSVNIGSKSYKEVESTIPFCEVLESTIPFCEVLESEYPVCEVLESTTPFCEVLESEYPVCEVLEYPICEEVKDKTAIVVFDGNSKSLQRFDVEQESWTKMQKQLTARKQQWEMLAFYNEKMVNDINYFSAAVLNDEIYVLMSSKAVYRLKYCGANATWNRMADMFDDHGVPPAAVMEGFIYVVGGSYPQYTTSVEKFDPSSNKWMKIRNKYTNSMNSSTASSKGRLYSIGGCTGGWNLSKVERFDPATSTWTYVAPMLRKRQCAAAVEFNDKIYVLGGFDGVAITTVEFYNPATDAWTQTSAMNVGRYYFTAFNLQGSIFAVGGRDSDQASIERFDPEVNNWEIFTRMDEMSVISTASVAI